MSEKRISLADLMVDDKIVVVKVLDPFTVAINRGSKDGIQPKDRFLVYAIDPEQIVDPVTRAVLGKLELVKGTATVLHIQDKLTTIKSDRFESNGRIIRRVGGTNSLMASILGETVEQHSDKNLMPFDDVKIGDSVKKI